MLIFGAKLWVHAISGSSAMLAEALHSVADVLNQVGGQRGKRTCTCMVFMSNLR